MYGFFMCIICMLMGRYSRACVRSCHCRIRLHVLFSINDFMLAYLYIVTEIHPAVVKAKTIEVHKQFDM